MVEIEIGSRLLLAIVVVVFGVIVERWWAYASKRRP